MTRTARRWTIAASVVACFVLVAAVLLYRNPFWLVDKSVGLYLHRQGVQHRHVMVDGNNIHYLEALPKAGSPERPLVLVHGLGARATDWAGLIAPLAADGYHVYAIDLLGYGESPKPQGADFSLAAEERVVSGFLRELRLQQVDLAGWSMGGWIAMKLALDQPATVRRLLLYDSAGLYQRIDFPMNFFTPEDRAGLDAMVSRIEPDKPLLHIPAFAVPGMLRRLAKSRRMIDSSFRSMLTGREVLDFRVHALKMPVLLVWGTEDKLTPFASAERLHELVPQSVLVGIDGCGHLAAAECAKQVLPVTERFLDSEPPLPASRTILPSAR